MKPAYLGDTTISSEKKRVIDAILCVFETGTPTPNYGAVTVLHDGAGISYGKHQSTDKSDSLDEIVDTYIKQGGAYAEELKSYMPRLSNDETTGLDPDHLPDWAFNLMSLLGEAGNDPVMQKAQDAVFESRYWNPAAQQALEMALQAPLSWLVCYDSTIQSGSTGIKAIRQLFKESPPSSGGNEHAWTKAYLFARKGWLISSSKAAVRGSVYRVDAMLEILNAGNWQLNTPISFTKPKAIVT